MPQGSSEKTRDKVGAALGVSGKTYEKAKAVVEKGVPALVAAVDAGEVSISAAAVVAELPKREQQKLVAEGPAAVKQAAAECRREKATAPKPGTVGEPQPAPPVVAIVPAEPEPVTVTLPAGVTAPVIACPCCQRRLRVEHAVTKPRKAKKPSPNPPGTHKAAIDAFKSKWEEKYQTKLPFNDGKDGQAVKWMLTQVEGDVQKLSAVFDRFLADTDPFHAADSRHNLGKLRANFARWLVAGPLPSKVVSRKVEAEVNQLVDYARDAFGDVQ